MNEQYKYDIIKNLVDNNGNKKRAANKLNCSIRTINRLITKYENQGKTGFIHGNRGRIPATSFPDETKSKIIELYMNDYGDANLRHFSEIVLQDLGISVSDTTLNIWLRNEGILSPKARKKTKKNMKMQLKLQLDNVSSEKIKNNIREAIAIIDSQDAHPRRPRCKYAGEMIQMDASSYNWIKDEIWHLHVAIDDATGEVVGAYFDAQETLKAYYHVFYQILTTYGIPALFYTDRRTVFEYKRKNTVFDNEDTFTQFSYACHQLGVEIKTTSAAQAKGRVERLNQTLQSRLPIELRRANITNIEDANEFLKHYLKEFNHQFALHLNSTRSVYEKQPDIELINRTLSIITPRKINNGHCIKYMNNYYIPVNSDGSRVYFKNKSDCMVIEAFDGRQYVNVLDQIYIMEEIPNYEEYSRNFDFDRKAKPKKKKQYIPPMSHP
ncbi:ISNCY family transposase, partial [Candidatus Stoquefichus massiliensis]|uniref:ISNCY family transposase n=1 Tax=Candidatus Stoquefichus massiliensis TaxID=1470350 RepID=UPI0005C8272D